MSVDVSTAQSRTIDVLDATGSKAGTVELPSELFDVTANIPLIHQVVVAQLAAARQGTHATKGRGEVRGGGKKPYRQKGTGRARQGSTRAPQYVGGGTVHGPQPHGYAQRTPKKMIAAALRGALSDRARDGRVYVIQDLVPGDLPSTKTALAALRAATSTDRVLVVLHRDEDLSWLSLRNVVTVHALAVDQLNTYDVLVNDEVVFTEAALAEYVARSTGGKAMRVVEPAELVEEPTNAELASTEPTNAELGLAEPSGAELASASVEDSAEPTDAELAATAASVAAVVEPAEEAAPAEAAHGLEQGPNADEEDVK
ncbi:MAG TPA: 50S ribosomal protein L4 [Propionibacteriaceae bacterium]|nr:50S ribosomal protein L4 [Propionibacteriaceae bacterium]